jgi:RNA polymerase sigma-70 factor (ECF subfamily)
MQKELAMFTHDELLKESSSLSKFAYKLTRNRDDADDLLQSTLVTALDKQNQFEQGTNLFSWTSRIMFNAFVSSYRHNCRFETQYDPQWYIDQQSVEATQESEAELSLVFDAIMSLSEDHREILRMVCIDGMQYNEVAEKLLIPVGTVRSRLSRAREGLQERLNISVDHVGVNPIDGNQRAASPTVKAPAETRIVNEASMIKKPDLVNTAAANESRKFSLENLASWRA